MNVINQAEMAGTRMALAQARKYPFLISLVARQDIRIVATFVLDHAESFALGGEKMYDYFKAVNAYVDDTPDAANLTVSRIERMCAFVEREFGECVFGIFVEKRGTE